MKILNIGVRLIYCEDDRIIMKFIQQYKQICSSVTELQVLNREKALRSLL